MNKKIFELFARYNKKVNEKMNEIIRSLSEEEWDKSFPGYYKSIHGLCSHIFGADNRWLKRFKTIREFKSLRDKRFDSEYGFNELFFKNITEYLTERTELDTIMVNFVNELKEEDLGKMFTWANNQGIELTRTLGTTLAHVFNHETSHRGMISLYLESLGKENDFTNLYLYE